MNLKSKLPDIGVTIFTRMTALANEWNAINLSQGFPDFEVDPELTGLVYKYMQTGFNQYAPMQGVMPLRERIAEKTFKLYKASYDPGNGNNGYFGRYRGSCLRQSPSVVNKGRRGDSF